MSRELFFVIGAPHTGRTTWINKSILKTDSNVFINADTYPNLYVKSEKKNASILYEDTIEDSRKWCVEQVKAQMESDDKPEQIVLSLIGCRPDRWREFIELAITNEYEIKFKFPTNKLLYYTTKHNTSMEQCKFIESKSLCKYPRDKKEVVKKNAKGLNETVMVDINESSLLKQMVMEAESAYAFYLQNKVLFGDKEKLLAKINEQYKSAILGEIKKEEKKLKDAEREAERKAKEEELKKQVEEEKLKKQVKEEETGQNKIEVEQMEQIEQAEQAQQEQIKQVELTA